MRKSEGGDPQERLGQASSWWTTSIIDIRPGVIRTRGHDIQDLIGQIGFAQMIWLMLRGQLPTVAQARLLEAMLVASVDHGPQAPSIAIARMAVTCGLPLNGAMASAVNVLGDVHGGAGQQCLELYQRALSLARGGDPGTGVEQALDEYTSRHGKIIPGFGHRFHPTDPRAPRLLAIIEEAIAEDVVKGDFARIALAVEASLRKRTGRNLPMNIDGVTAAMCGELGFEPPLARGLFVLSRSVGILTHAWEQAQQGHRLKGPMPTSIPYRFVAMQPDGHE